MTTAVGIILGIAGVIAIIVGLAISAVFWFGIRMFDRSLKTEIAAEGREQVERAAMKIRNPVVRRFVTQHLVATGGTIAVSVVRGALQSRMRLGSAIAVGGAIAIYAAFHVGSWLPLMWKPA
jgi:uncharacterized protein YgbK (DUF1537 family)